MAPATRRLTAIRPRAAAVLALALLAAGSSYAANEADPCWKEQAAVDKWSEFEKESSAKYDAELALVKEVSQRVKALKKLKEAKADLDLEQRLQRLENTLQVAEDRLSKFLRAVEVDQPELRLRKSFLDRCRKKEAQDRSNFEDVLRQQRIKEQELQQYGGEAERRLFIPPPTPQPPSQPQPPKPTQATPAPPKPATPPPRPQEPWWIPPPPPHLTTKTTK